ncbi:MAG: hypothetical protein HZB33_11280 [Nitrospirae bacterium]|nr:hypothetical protein [Nitrospirota bacterium]
MNNSLSKRKNAARLKKKQLKLDSGFLDAQFPEVTAISISMMYHQNNMKESLPRVVNFFPGSYALFRVACLNKECVDGGFDLTKVITGMIKTRKEASKGTLSCKGETPAAMHSSIVYEVSIQYT